MSAQTLATARTAAAARLRAAGIDTPDRDARALTAHAAGLAPDRLTLESQGPITAAQQQTLDALLARREAREPVSRILGTRLFWGRPFRVTDDVLDPRPETETLIALALDGPAVDQILDLGTGTGCIGLTLAAEWPRAQVTLTDLSPRALAVARQNANDLGLAARVQFLEGPWFSPVHDRFDLILSNPPYIAAADVLTLAPEVRDWDPHLALTAGSDGFDAYRALSAGLARAIAPDGRALFEFGVGQGPQVRQLFEATKDATCRLHPDLSGRDRVLEVRF